MEVRFEEVPPPENAPVHQIAETLGVANGLRAERAIRGQWRCGCCSKMQPDKSWQVWVPDSVRRGDPVWSVTEAARRGAYNGGWTAWCLSCAPKAPKQPVTADTGRQASNSFLDNLIRRFKRKQ